MEYMAKLNGTNYQEWSGWIEILLKSKQAYEVIETKVENIGPEEMKAYERLNIKAMVLFFTSMDDYHMELVCRFEYAFDVWQFFRARYGKFDVKDVDKCGGGGDGNFDGRRGSVNGGITEVEHKNARITPDIGGNMISVGQLPEEGSEESREVIERTSDQSLKEAPFDAAISNEEPRESSAVDARDEASTIDVSLVDASGEAIILMNGLVTDVEQNDARLTPDMGVIQISVGQLSEEESVESRVVFKRTKDQSVTEAPVDDVVVNDKESLVSCGVDARGATLTDDGLTVDARGETLISASDMPNGVNVLSEAQTEERLEVRRSTQGYFEVPPLCHGITAVLETEKVSESHKEAVDLIHAEEWRDAKLDELDLLVKYEIFDLVVNPLVENQSAGVFEDVPNGLELTDAMVDFICDGILKEKCRVSCLHFYHQLADCLDEFVKSFEENKKFWMGYSPEVT